MSKKFSLSKYLKYNHDKENPELVDECFEDDETIDDYMEKYGKLNDIVYSIKRAK